MKVISPMPSKFSSTTPRGALSKAIIEAAKDKDWIGASDLLKDVCLIYGMSITESSLSGRLRQLFFWGIFDRLLVEKGMDGHNQYYVYKLLPQFDKIVRGRSEAYWSNLETDHIGIKRMIEANRNMFSNITLKNYISWLTRISKEADLDDPEAVKKRIDSYFTSYKGNYRRAYEVYLRANKT